MKKITKEEFNQIMSENPSNEDLRYLIEYTEYKQQAWEQLLKQNPSNDDLRHLIEHTDYKQEA